MPHTLHALVVNLIAQNGGTLPGNVGELGHAAFYAAIQAVDPALSARMHEADERSAFSLSPLYGYWQSPQDGKIHVSQGQPGWLRVCLLEPELFAVFTTHLLTSARPTIHLGDVHFAITDALGNPVSHPWAGYTTLDDLAALPPAERWILEFESPTAIRWGKSDNGSRRVELFPLPRMAIAGLRSRWDKWTGEQWGRDFEEWVERNVIIERVWDWRSERFVYRGQNYVGGVGKLSWRLLDSRDKERAAHLNRLLHLAFYTGVGYKTTHGLGQVRLLPAAATDKQRRATDE
ncbi:MAG: CRISPR-associated endoribonuclease Cas6 [Caldilineaceae bacterium]|nr:CRISPR-associated endoribonuclease Cas6 [Caldilineaceae bacterium]HRJ41872.1 CRISPR system precrRNA processing endoribonuclease RAMP protein Cas6 [Caldilineaceae bacterium]